MPLYTNYSTTVYYHQIFQELVVSIWDLLTFVWYHFSHMALIKALSPLKTSFSHSLQHALTTLGGIVHKIIHMVPRGQIGFGKSLSKKNGFLGCITFVRNFLIYFGCVLYIKTLICNTNNIQFLFIFKFAAIFSHMCTACRLSFRPKCNDIYLKLYGHCSHWVHLLLFYI